MFLWVAFVLQNIWPGNCYKLNNFLFLPKPAPVPSRYREPTLFWGPAFSRRRPAVWRVPVPVGFGLLLSSVPFLVLPIWPPPCEVIASRDLRTLSAGCLVHDFIFCLWSVTIA